METLPRLHEDKRAAFVDDGVDDDVDAFLDTLRQEQTRLLDHARLAASALQGRHGRLATLAARHLRLTRLFLDAQRALLQRSAEVEAELARAGGAGEDRSLTVRRADDRERQLATMLDLWWSAEVADGRTVVAVAQTRACEPHEVLAPVLAALDAVDPADLDPLLSALAACFEPAVAAEADIVLSPTTDPETVSDAG